MDTKNLNDVYDFFEKNLLNITTIVIHPNYYTELQKFSFFYNSEQLRSFGVVGTIYGSTVISSEKTPNDTLLFFGSTLDRMYINLISRHIDYAVDFIKTKEYKSGDYKSEEYDMVIMGYNLKTNKLKFVMGYNIT